MTGVIFPDSTSSLSVARFSLLGVAVTWSSRCRTKRDTNCALRRRPIGPTRLPPPDTPPPDRMSVRRGQYPPALGQRTVPHQVEDDVVPPSVPGEVLVDVVDDMVRADRPDQVHVPGVAHAGHHRTERLGDLNGEGPHAT